MYVYENKEWARLLKEGIVRQLQKEKMLTEEQMNQAIQIMTQELSEAFEAEKCRKEVQWTRNNKEERKARP